MNRFTLLFAAVLAVGPVSCDKKQEPAPPAKSITTPPVEPTKSATSPSGAPTFEPPKSATTPRVEQAKSAAVPVVVRDDWHAKPDPSAEKPVVWPAGWKLSIPLSENIEGTYGRLAFAADGGPYVAVTDGAPDSPVVNVYDLRTGKTAGAVKELGLASGGSGRRAGVLTLVCLSRDGATLAAVVLPGGGLSKTLTTFDVATGKKLATVGEASTGLFVGSDALFVRGDERLQDAGARVVDLKTGKERVKLSANTNGLWAVSPGGAYVARADYEGVITIYATADGKEAGQLKKPEKSSDKFKGLAFSPDGSALAAYMDSPLAGSCVVWSMATGLADAVPPSRASPSILNEGFEWLLDGTGWLVGGTHVVDRETGQMILAHPRQRTGQIGRLAVNAGTIIQAAPPAVGQPSVLTATTIPTEKVAALRAALRTGGTASDVEMPPLTAVDADKVPAVKGPPVGVPWTPFDAAPAPPAPPAKPITLNRPASEIDELFVADGRAVVQTAGGPRTLETTDMATGKVTAVVQTAGGPRTLEATDMATGKVTATVKLPAGLMAVAVSADGTLVAALDSAERRRVDVWSLKTQKHVAGWRPPASPPPASSAALPGGAVITFVAFAGPILVTVSSTGDVIGWEPTTATLKYRTVLYGIHARTVSPGGRHLLGMQSGVIRAMDTATGQVVGDLEPAGVKSTVHMVIAVRPDGREVAAYFQTRDSRKDERPQLVRWGADGRRIAVVEAALGPATFLGKYGGHIPAPFAYAGPECLLASQYLFDLTRKVIVWQYGYVDHAIYPVHWPAGQAWTATAATVDGPVVLVGTVVPDATAAKSIAAVAGPANLLKPGTKIAVRVTATGAHADLAAAPVLARVQQTLKARKFEYAARAEDADLLLTITLTEKATGQMRDFSVLKDQKMTVPEIEVFTATDLRVGDTVVWAMPVRKTLFGSIPEEAVVPRTTDKMKAMMTRGVWDLAIQYAGFVPLPLAAAKTADGGAALPGWTTFTPTGLTNGPPPALNNR